MTAQTTNKKKVLIIDDDSFLLSMYSMKFEKNGFETKTLNSGREAIDLLKSGYKPDILIMDLVMPVLDGFAIYEELKDGNLIGGILTVLLTNQSTLADINKARELGIDGFIVKATTIPSEVVERVKELFNKKTA